MTIFSGLSDRLFGRSRVRAEGREVPPPAERMCVLDPAKVFTPDPALIESYTKIDESDTANIRTKGDKIFYREIPYSKYLGVLHFHPNRIGGYMTASKLTPRLAVTARNLLNYAAELPNGGLALYYPRAIDTARLQVNEPIYSGIAQGQILAGFTRLIRDQVPQKGPQSWHEVAERVALSLMFPFEQGGVCTDGRVILEAPNFRACPETILNGWIDALIRFYDYLQFVPNRTYQEFYDRNIAALCELLPDFDDKDAQLSLYSNLCPYTFRLHFRRARGNAPPPNVRVEYVPVKRGYAGYVIPELWNPGPELRNCIYENKIENSRSATMDVSLSVCSLYDIVITVDADCTHLSYDPGTYNETSTVPRRTLSRRSLAPAAGSDATRTVFVVRAAEDGLMAGCPTNFIKKSENFYHGYHVVALYELAITTPDPAQRKIIADFANRWLDYIKSPKHDHLIGKASFVPPESFVKKITRFRALPHTHSFDELRALANAPQ
jgi:hypothetical protein